MDSRARRSRETSPDRARVYVQPKTKTFKKVQVLYYLCRNGQLEHPHFMEVPHLANQQLRLKDVIDRLTVLRGKGMPSLFSWSCKRSYKNGYVWNDLGENDVIYPAEGAEYILKGSELIEGCAEKFQQLQVSNRQHSSEPIFYSKRKLLVSPQHREPEEVEYVREEEEAAAGDSNSNTTNTYSRCSRGVSTDEIEERKNHHKIQNNSTEITLDDGSPPSTCSTVSEKAHEPNNNSQRFQDCNSDSVPERIMTRNSVLFQLIACGSSMATRGRNVNVPSPTVTNARKSSSSSSLHKGVLCRTATKMAEEDEINYMSENPRFGNLQSEEKEYFSGSIVESMTEDRAAVEPALKKSASYNEERSSKVGLGEAVEEEVEKEAEERCMMKGKCIPRKKSSSSKQPKK
ncbi:PREDICTED: protein UPSTREAM OF FLC-like [Nelumbo nucifera]|uniref:Protein UPSTREAM OF FLC-like n=2 Tax=Nelumbo nucifera TaxID=4432 RepID=A0A1U8AGV9_NELNU|nr:PREDICTED: protein UPSTREAM OF FLC-like [Nelumbo nucifera]DAD40284.1 TPA_asm: hypothetical protein HUJ06_014607 [Nelumbo nucifera]